MTPAQKLEVRLKDSNQYSCMFDTSKIEYSWKDKKKGIVLPEKMTPDLAYLVGVHIGDGCMNIYKRKGQVDYYYSLCGHEINDRLFHNSIMIPLFKKLFNIEAKSRMNSPGCCMLGVRSKALVTFLNQCIGLPLGKKDKIDIPKTILDSGLENSLACIKGIFDTDFSLTFKNKNKTVHSYPIIDLKANSKSLVYSVESILSTVGFKGFIMKRRTKDKRFNKEIVQWILTISGKDNLRRWFELIGSKNPSYLSRYAVWRNFGFVPPYTDYLTRKDILLGKIDPLELYKK